ncbi:hypothetical protein, partial [Janthinobacterium sp.]|uniref:hypothetical protein n=1 Tax=Janthinobacterium sp. TaxID=1871054 RepID=UPI002604FD57
MGQWFAFNPIEQIARDAGASQTAAYWIGLGATLVGNPKSLVTKGVPSIVKAINSNLPHAIERAVERGIFKDAESAAEGLRSMAAQLSKEGFPANAIPDTA